MSRLVVNRLEAGSAPLDLRAFSDLVIVTEGNKLSGLEVPFARKQLEEVKFFTVGEDANYQDAQQ